MNTSKKRRYEDINSVNGRSDHGSVSWSPMKRARNQSKELPDRNSTIKHESSGIYQKKLKLFSKNPFPIENSLNQNVDPCSESVIPRNYNFPCINAEAIYSKPLNYKKDTNIGMEMIKQDTPLSMEVSQIKSNPISLPHENKSRFKYNKICQDHFKIRRQWRNDKFCNRDVVKLCDSKTSFPTYRMKLNCNRLRQENFDKLKKSKKNSCPLLHPCKDQQQVESDKFERSHSRLSWEIGMSSIVHKHYTGDKCEVSCISRQSKAEVGKWHDVSMEWNEGCQSQGESSVHTTSPADCEPKRFGMEGKELEDAESQLSISYSNNVSNIQYARSQQYHSGHSEGVEKEYYTNARGSKGELQSSHLTHALIESADRDTLVRLYSTYVNIGNDTRIHKLILKKYGILDSTFRNVLGLRRSTEKVLEAIRCELAEVVHRTKVPSRIDEYTKSTDLDSNENRLPTVKNRLSPSFSKVVEQICKNTISFPVLWKTSIRKFVPWPVNAASCTKKRKRSEPTKCMIIGNCSNVWINHDGEEYYYMTRSMKEKLLRFSKRKRKLFHPERSV